MQVGQLLRQSEPRLNHRPHVAVVAQLSVGVAHDEIDPAVAVKIAGSNRRACPLQHVEIERLSLDGSDVDRFPVRLHQLQALFLEPIPFVLMQINMPAVRAVQQIEPPVAVKVGQVREHPAVAATGRMVDVVSRRQQGSRYKPVVRLAVVNV